MIKYIKSLNWSGYLFCLILGAIAALGNDMATTFIGWLIPFLIGAFLSTFILIAGRKEDVRHKK